METVSIDEMTKSSLITEVKLDCWCFDRVAHWWGYAHKANVLLQVDLWLFKSGEMELQTIENRRSGETRVMHYSGPYRPVSSGIILGDTAFEIVANREALTVNAL